MKYSLSHLEDHVLRRDLSAAALQYRGATTWLLAHIAEFDARKLYAREAYSSMHLYCVRELGMSDDAAYARIRVARKAREFPAIFPALADGRLNQTAVVLLTPHLTSETATDLLEAAAHKTSAEIRLLLAERFPQPDMPTLVQAVVAPVATYELAAQRVEVDGQLGLNPVETAGGVEVAIRPPDRTTPQLVSKRVDRAILAPLSPGRFAWQVTVDQETQDLLRSVQALLGHAVPSGDVATVLKRALKSLAREPGQRKFGKSARSRPRRSSGNGRYIPAAIRNAIWDRDGGQCTFVSESGIRCEERKGLDFDHIDPVARGGQASVDRMRLLCRAHNQYTADCTFGAGFMREKRQQAQLAAQARKRARSEACVNGNEPTGNHATEPPARPDVAITPTNQPDVLSCLRRLGFTSEEAHRGAALCADIPDAPLEKRVHAALRGLAPPWARREAHEGAGASGGTS